MAESLEAMRQKRLAALSRHSGGTPDTSLQTTPHRNSTTPPSSSYSRPSQPSVSHNNNNNNIHTLSSVRSNPGSGTRLATSSRTQVVTQTHELYVRLPSKEITSEQLVQFIKIQFGVNVVVRHMNTKHQSYQMSERNFCFIDCDSREDMERLIEEMNDSTIGEWEDPIVVKEKLDHPKSGWRTGGKQERI